MISEIDKTFVYQFRFVGVIKQW